MGIINCFQSLFYGTNLWPFQKALKPYGFEKLDESAFVQFKSDIGITLILSNQKVVFVFYHSWHDQEIMVYLGSHPFSIKQYREKTSFINIAVEKKLIHESEKRDFSSWYHQPYEQLIENQINLIKTYLDTLVPE